MIPALVPVSVSTTHRRTTPLSRRPWVVLSAVRAQVQVIGHGPDQSPHSTLSGRLTALTREWFVVADLGPGRLESTSRPHRSLARWGCPGTITPIAGCCRLSRRAVTDPPTRATRRLFGREPRPAQIVRLVVGVDSSLTVGSGFEQIGTVWCPVGDSPVPEPFCRDQHHGFEPTTPPSSTEHRWKRHLGRDNWCLRRGRRFGTRGLSGPSSRIGVSGLVARPRARECRRSSSEPTGERSLHRLESTHCLD